MPCLVYRLVYIAEYGAGNISSEIRFRYFGEDKLQAPYFNFTKPSIHYASILYAFVKTSLNNTIFELVSKIVLMNDVSQLLLRLKNVVLHDDHIHV